MGLERRTKSELVAEIEALRESLARYERLVATGTDLFAEIDEQGRFLFISPNFEAVLGYRAEDLVGRTLLDSVIFGNVHPEDRDTILESYEQAISEGERTLEYRYRRADGVWRWFESRGNTYRSSDGQMRSVTISRDVTDRVTAQHELQKSEARLRVLIENTYDLIAELDSEGRVIFLGPSSDEVLGYKPEELIGTTPFSLLHPGDVEPLANAFLERVNAQRPAGRGRIFRIRHRDGSWRWLEGGGVNYESADGELRVVSVSRDVTERVRADEERRRIEEWVQQAQKLESLGVMARGIAHDFNNLLTPILGDASLALNDLPSDSPVRFHIEKIQKAAHHAATLTNQMLDYAGAGPLHPETVDLSRLVLEMGQLLETAASRKAVLTYDLAADLPSIQADSAQISQVVLNLITNAAEAIEPEDEPAGHIAIRTGTVDVDRESLTATVLGNSLAEGTYVFFEVEDTGAGMNAETRSRMFDPFFSTKFTGRGLGLAAVLGIVRAHRGTIEIESAAARGTRMRVLFPPASTDLQPSTPAPPAARDWRGGGTVLVADDDEGARDFTTEVLTRAGLKVLCAADGREAVETFRRHAGEIGVVLLDRTMPAAGGEEAFDEMSRIDPGVPIVLVSGYSEQNIARMFAGKGFAGFLQKPFLPEVLIEKVRQLLEN